MIGIHSLALFFYIFGKNTSPNRACTEKVKLLQLI